MAFFSAIGCGDNDLPANAKLAMESADHFELFSLDPSHEPVPPAPGNFHGFRVLGSTVITDRSTQKKLTEALRTGVGENRDKFAACFDPRHGIHLAHGDKTLDLVICFECLQVQVFEGEQHLKGFLTSASPQPVFDQVLRAAGVTLADKPK